MVAQNVFFAILAILMIVSALKVVTTKNIVHAALWLVLVLAGVAGQFLLLGAEFVGVTQIFRTSVLVCVYTEKVEQIVRWTR